MKTDVLVIGAGPAGLAAAIEASRLGAAVVIIDAQRAPGGQIFREQLGLRSGEPVAKSGGRSTKDRLFAEFATERATGRITMLNEHVVWGCDGIHEVYASPTPESVGPHDSRIIRAQSVVLAPGAYDRPVAIPGWTLPGVMGAGGLQTFVKSQRVVPGTKFLLAGAGPLQLVVAQQLIDAGAEIVGLVEAAPLQAMASSLLGAAFVPNILFEGLGYLKTIRAGRAPLFFGHVLTEIGGDGAVEGATIMQVDRFGRRVPGSEKSFDVDMVALGYGLQPNLALYGLFGCKLDYDDAAQSWLPRRNDVVRTSVARVYAAGDGARVAGVHVAVEEGRVAGMRAAEDAGCRHDEGSLERLAVIQRKLKRLRAFRRIMDRAGRLPSGLFEMADETTVVCRCEDVTAAQCRAALERNAKTLREVKLRTRAGMGLCQGRMCESTLQRLVASGTGRSLHDVVPGKTQAPIYPVKGGHFAHPGNCLPERGGDSVE